MVPGIARCCRARIETKQKNIIMKSYIPSKDAEFSAWLLNFSSKLTAAPATYGLIAADAVIVAGFNTAWATAYAAATNPATRTSVTIAAKDAARADAEGAVRPYAQRIKVNPAVTNASRAAIGVTINSFPPTPIPAPTTSPSLILVSAAPNVANLQYRDSSSPTAKAKPYGVKRLLLFRSIGVGPAVNPDAAQYIGAFTKSPLQVETTAGDRGKTATYFACWETASGPGGVASRGPWGDPLTVICQ